jgi:hypothetical protein
MILEKTMIVYFQFTDHKYYVPKWEELFYDDPDVLLSLIVSQCKNVDS